MPIRTAITHRCQYLKPILQYLQTGGREEEENKKNMMFLIRRGQETNDIDKLV